MPSETGAKATEGEEPTVPETPTEGLKEEAHAGPLERDYRKELEELRTKNRKVEEDKENYRRGLLARDAELKRERERREALELGGSEEVVSLGVDEDAIAERIAQKLAPTFVKNSIDEAIKAYTIDPDKSALIRFHYDNSLVKTGYDSSSVMNDIQRAVALADAPRMRYERDEAMRAATAKRAEPLGGAGHAPGADSVAERAPHGWTPEQVSLMNERHKIAVGKEMTDAEIKRAWDTFKSGQATAQTGR